MRPRVLALVDGEHYPPVVRAAIEQASATADVVAALLLGGTEKLAGAPDYGVPLERLSGDAASSMLDAAARHGADRVLDLSDEPVLSEERRMWLAANALAAGLAYEGADFELRPPQAEPLAAPALAVVGTGKRVGKTAISAHTARLLRDAGREVVVVAMGRGGPEQPELVSARERPIGMQELLERSRAGMHAASDFLEDAVLTGVPAVGARRCGGGLAGGTYLSNAVQAARLAESLHPQVLLLEGSGAAVPPLRADRTVLVTSARRPAAALTTGLGPVRVLRADLVVITMAEQGCDDTREAIEAVAPQLATVAVTLRPQPCEPLGDAPVAFFTTAPPERAAALAAGIAADVVAVVPALSDRDALRRALDRDDVRAAQTYLVEIKAAAVDVVCETAESRGLRVVFCDNVPEPVAGEPDLDAALLELANQAMAVHA
jgi:cyclic 2,3-diphosphoglycerate synthetase